MACSNNQFFPHLHHHFALTTYSLILLISLSTSFFSQGRMLPQSPDNYSKKVILESAMFRPKIGSRPPQCERRCNSCAHCEAVQVPTNPTGTRTRNSSAVSAVAYARDQESSNYKPMSWKCKCGDLIFNP